MKDFGIIQFNCGNANYRSARPIFDAVSPANHPVLAIQEPYFNSHAKTTYCPRAFTLAHDGTLQAKVCFMVSKALSIDSWQFKAYSGLVAALRLRLAAATVTIINVYNPISSSNSIETWDRIQQALNDAEG